MTDKDYNRLEIEEFVKIASNMHLLEIVDHCTKKEKWLEDIAKGRNKHNIEARHMAIKLRDFMGAVCFVLHGNPICPAGLSHELWKQAKPIFDELAKREEIPWEWIDKIFAVH